MKIIKIDELELVANPHNVEARKVYENDYAEVMHLTLKPGEHLIKHQLPVDVFFFILEGSGIIEMGDEQQKVERNSLIEGPANVPRGWINNTNDLLKILVVKTPKPSLHEKIKTLKSMNNNL
jgi:mannose-6-phosphate isomerase-like protein (cupin superfamily)